MVPPHIAEFTECLKLPIYSVIKQLWAINKIICLYSKVRMHGRIMIENQLFVIRLLLLQISKKKHC